MGEDRVAFSEKRTNGDVLSSGRQRHSSVISSCSEDAESETTISSGYPPTPDEEREEELEYGPGIVNKLRTRFLTITLKQNRGSSMRRSCSMENLLDQDRPLFRGGHANGFVLDSSELDSNNKNRHHPTWGNLKRAKSMDTLLMDLQPEPPPPPTPETNNGGDPKPKIFRKARTVPMISDEELPKPDTVKTYKRMFEPAESRRGSYSRRPPVLRASAKSGGLSVSKTNNNNVVTSSISSSSAKVNGVLSKNSKPCAKQSPVNKAQPDPESTLSNIKSGLKPVNGEESKPLCNGNIVRATPVKIVDVSLTNGNTEKTPETEVNGLSVSKKELLNNQKNGLILNGSSALKELIKSETNEDYVKLDVKKLVKQTNNKIVNGSSENPVINTALNGVVTTTKPKVPPNRPAFIKNNNNKPIAKFTEPNGIDKKPLIPKLKPVQKKIADVSKNETKNKPAEAPFNNIAPKLNGEAKEEIKESKLPKSTPSEKKAVDEKHNRRNAEKEDQKVTEKKIHVDKTDHVPTKKEEPEKEIIKQQQQQVNGNAVVDTEKTNSPHKSEPVEIIKHEPKPVKKSSDPITTSMVFDFRGKDVVPHVAVLPTPFGCKALHPKKKPLLIDGKESPGENGVASDDDDEYHMDYSVPPPSGVTFEGENIRIGKGSILSTRNKELKIKFDDNVDDNTFVYPSETSLLEDSESSTSPSPPPSEGNGQQQTNSSKLKANTSIGSSVAGGFSTYTPSVLRTMDNFEPGMFRPPPPPPPEKQEGEEQQSGEEENCSLIPEQDQEQEQMLKPADPGIISSWSLSAGTSDLLF